MALPNFFDKSALSLRQLLADGSREEYIRRLEQEKLFIAFGPEAVSSAEGRVSLELLTNLLTRMFPALGWLSEGNAASDFARNLEALARSINPEISVLSEGAATLVFQVGAVATQTGGDRFYIGSTDWTARFSTSAPQSCGQSGVPFGAAAAACFAAANAFRRVFGDLLPSAKIDERIELCLYRYGCPVDRPPLGPFSMGEAFLVGAGAIGNAAVWAWARTAGLTGKLHVIDPQKIDISNLQRYALTTQTSVGRSKVELAADELRQSGIAVVPHAEEWGVFASRSGVVLGRVAVALDSGLDRIHVQGALPREIYNAWTQRENLGVSRHRRFGADTCLACLYLPDRPALDRDDEIRIGLNLPDTQPQQQELRILLHTKRPLAPEFIARVAAASAVPVAKLERFVGQPIESLYAGAVCGGIILRSGAGREVDVPMPFQSALAGVMLAAELVAPARQLPSKTTIDLLRPLAPYLSFEHPRQSNGRCICQDQDYTSRYVAKWGTYKPAFVTPSGYEAPLN